MLGLGGNKYNIPYTLHLGASIGCFPLDERASRVCTRRSAQSLPNSQHKNKVPQDCMESKMKPHHLESAFQARVCAPYIRSHMASHRVIPTPLVAGLTWTPHRIKHS